MTAKLRRGLTCALALTGLALLIPAGLGRTAAGYDLTWFAVPGGGSQSQGEATLC